MAAIKIDYTRGDKTIFIGLHDVKDSKDLYATVREMVEKLVEILHYGKVEAK